MTDNYHIRHVTNSIVEKFNPTKIILFSCKHNLKNEVTSFKLVVVSPHNNDLVHDIYMTIDCDIPYDVVTYSQEEWETALETPNSFAQRVNGKGTLLYE